MSPVMIGRVGPLTRLIGLVEAAEVASGDEPAIGLVSGEAGIGKTRLISEFVARPGGALTERPVVVEVIRAQPGSIDRPFDTAGPLRGRLGIADDVDLDFAVVEVFERRLLEGPVVVVVEDVHWIDADSAALVDLLARQPWSGLVVVCTYRAGVLRRGSPGGELVARLERNHTSEQVRLERLDRQEIGALVMAIIGEAPSSAVVDSVAHRSEGVPFVIEELVRAVRPGKAGSDDAAAAISSAELPWSLSDAVRQQLSGLDDDARRLVEGLAVMDDIASFDTIQIICELDASELTAALRDLVGNGVLDEVGDDRFWFSHALMAETISGELLGRERRRLHGRCLLALTRESPPDVRPDYAAMVRHAHSAGRFEEIAEHARLGSRIALDTGSTFLALRLASQGLDEECDDPDLLAITTEAAWRLDFLDEAAEHATRWVAAASGPALVDALRMESRISFERDELDLAEAALRRLVDVAEAHDTPTQVRAAAEAALSQLFMFTHRSEESVAWADKALVHADEAGDKVSSARAATERASALAWLIPQDKAEAELRAAIESARAANDFIATARGLGNLLTLVPAHTVAGQAIVDELRQLVRRAGFDKLGAVVAMRSCDVAIGRGDLAAARRAVAESWTSWMQVGTRSWAAATQAMLAIEEGRFIDGESVLRTMSRPGAFVATRVAVNEDPFHVPVLWVHLAALEGNRPLGVAAFEALVRIESGWTCFFDDLVVVIDAALTVGIEPARIRSALIDQIRGLEAIGTIEDASSYLEGLLAAGDRRYRDAVALLEPLVGSDDVDERVGALRRAIVRMALARSYLSLGDRRRAREVIRLVLDVDLARWPGVRRDRTEEMARRLESPRADAGARAANVADAGPGGSLTPRELEVATLLAEGLTNGQLAERLFISPKTAAVHVSNILAKLGLSSRAEIAAWAVRREALTAS